jgi:integrase
MAMLADPLACRGLTGADAEALVVVDPAGRGLDWRIWVWVPPTRAEKLDGLRFHDLRRAAATTMVAAGVDPRTARARLGHSDPRLTLALKAQATSVGDRAASDVLGAALTPTDTVCPTRAEIGR